eukprot:9476115-Pyramimonas_sp.AAC.1
MVLIMKMIMQLAQSRRTVDGDPLRRRAGASRHARGNSHGRARSQVQRAGPGQGQGPQPRRASSVRVRGPAGGADKSAGEHRQGEPGEAAGDEGTLEHDGLRRPHGHHQVHQARQVLRPDEEAHHFVPGRRPQGGDRSAGPAWGGAQVGEGASDAHGARDAG